MGSIDKRILNFLVIIALSFATFTWTFFIFHVPIDYAVILGVIVVRMIASRLILRDYSLSWSKATQKTFLIKTLVYGAAFVIYLPVFYGEVYFSFLASELLLYLFFMTFSMYAYYYYINRSDTLKTKNVVIYGAGRAGLKLESEFGATQYKVQYFIDDDPVLQKQSIDTIQVISEEKLREMGCGKFDLLVIAMPSESKGRIKEIYENLKECFSEIQVLPSLDQILREQSFAKQLKEISVEDLLARHPQDLHKEKIEAFVRNKTILVTGAGGSIGSEICRQCEKYGARQLILLDHSEYNLYAIMEELSEIEIIPAMQSVVNVEQLEHTFAQYKPQIVIHAAAYKHVPLVESNIEEGIVNNVIGTKNIIDASIHHGVEKFVMISTDKAVRPTNVMGATKRICELYAQNANGQGTDIVAVRFGNVLGSSGSVIPKFKKQIEAGGPITVTHPDITRYFMLIPEACELVLQAAAIGTGGEIFILDMGKPIKIVDLAKKMCELSGREDIEIVFSGLRPGEKLYEELLIDESNANTEYDSITIAKPTPYNLEKLNQDIDELVSTDNRLEKLREIVPEFDHKKNA